MKRYFAALATQVEIEVVASLLDDWESLFPIATEAAE